MQYRLKQFKNNDYEMKTVNGTTENSTAMYFKAIVTIQNKDKIERFIARLEEFKKVATLKDAKELMNKIMPTQREKTIFNIGNGKCTIINKEDTLKICFKTPKKFICYCFN